MRSLPASKRGLRDTTRVSYRGHLDHYLIPALGQYRLVDLERRPELIEDWVSSLTIGTCLARTLARSP